MTIGLVDTTNNSVIRRWNGSAGRVEIPGVGQAHNPQVGYENGDYKVVSIVTEPARPTPFHENVGETAELVGDTLTLTTNWQEKSDAVISEDFRDRVNRQREWRIEQGVTVTLSTDNRTFSVQTGAIDIHNIMAMVVAAQVRIANADATTFLFRDADNVGQVLTSVEMIEVGMVVVQHTQRIYESSWVLKDTTPLVRDYADDEHWV